MIKRTDDYVMASTQDSFFDLDYRFGFEQGFNIAIAFTSFDSKNENILTPDIGRIVYKQFAWGSADAIESFYAQDYLPTHVCTNEELGIDQETENSFFPFRDIND